MHADACMSWWCNCCHRALRSLLFAFSTPCFLRPFLAVSLAGAAATLAASPKPLEAWARNRGRLQDAQYRFSQGK